MSQIPLGDFGDPIDIAEVTAFLASKRYPLNILSISSLIAMFKKKRLHQESGIWRNRGLIVLDLAGITESGVKFLPVI